MRMIDLKGVDPLEAGLSGIAVGWMVTTILIIACNIAEVNNESVFMLGTLLSILFGARLYFRALKENDDDDEV